MSAKKLTVTANEVICRKGDEEKDIYLVLKGKLLICNRSGRMVTPLAHIGEGEYFGEMSFFDNESRSADVVAIEDTELLRIPPQAVKAAFPKWLLFTTRNMTRRLRVLDSVVADKGLKRKNVESIKPLSIDEQRKLFEILEKTE